MNKILKVIVISALGLSLVGCNSKLEKSYENALKFKDELSTIVIELNLIEEDLLDLSFEPRANIEEIITNTEEVIKELDSSRCGSGSVILSADVLKTALLEEIKVLNIKPLNVEELQKVKRKIDELYEEYLNEVSVFLESIEKEIVIDKFV